MNNSKTIDRDNVKEISCYIVMCTTALLTLLSLEVAMMVLLFGRTAQEATHMIIGNDKGRLGLVGQIVAGFFPLLRTYFRMRNQEISNKRHD
jgi:hypothetical protein